MDGTKVVLVSATLLIILLLVLQPQVTPIWLRQADRAVPVQPRIVLTEWDRIWNSYDRGMLLLATGSTPAEVSEFWHSELRPFTDGPFQGDVEQLLVQLDDRLADESSAAWIQEEPTDALSIDERRSHHWKWIPYGTGLVTADTRIVRGRVYPWSEWSQLIQHLTDRRLMVHYSGMRVENYALWCLTLSTGISFSDEPDFPIDDSIRADVERWWSAAGQYDAVAGAIGGLQFGDLEQNVGLIRRLEAYEMTHGVRDCATVFDGVDFLRHQAEGRGLTDRLYIARLLNERSDVSLLNDLCDEIMRAVAVRPNDGRAPLGIGYLAENGSPEHLLRLCEVLKSALMAEVESDERWIKYVVKWYLFRRPEMVPLMIEAMNRFPQDVALRDVCLRWSIQLCGAPDRFRSGGSEEVIATASDDKGYQAWEDEQWESSRRTGAEGDSALPESVARQKQQDLERIAKFTRWWNDEGAERFADRFPGFPDKNLLRVSPYVVVQPASHP